MRSFLSCFSLLCVSCFDAYTTDVCVCDTSRRSYYLCSSDNMHGNFGSGALVNLPIRSSYETGNDVLFLSCQHSFTRDTYDAFGDKQFCLFAGSSYVIPYKLHDCFYKRASDHYSRLIHQSYMCDKLTVNKTDLNLHVNIHKLASGANNKIGELNRQYLTFCMPNIKIPIDISVLLANNVDTSFVKIYELPTNDQITSWKNKSVKVTIYGYPASKGSEYSVTCDMRLTDCGNWFKSLEPIPQCFLDLHGMSGGPGFTDEEVLCGVMSGCDNDRHLCVRALTTDLVEAIKFGVEKMLDK